MNHALRCEVDVIEELLTSKGVKALVSADDPFVTKVYLDGAP